MDLYNLAVCRQKNMANNAAELKQAWIIKLFIPKQYLKVKEFATSHYH